MKWVLLGLAIPGVAFLGWGLWSFSHNAGRSDGVLMRNMIIYVIGGAFLSIDAVVAIVYAVVS